jgi:hypothetical protein
VTINYVSIRMDASEAVYSQAMVVADEPVLADDDDDREYPEFVDWFDRCDDEDVDEMSALVPFDDTDEEEREENVDMGTGGGEEDEDISIIEYGRDNPFLIEGTIFPSIIDCRNALATFCIKGEYDFVIDKSDTTRFRVHCSYSRCNWRMHACHTWFLRAKPDAHRMYAQDQVVIHTVRM